MTTNPALARIGGVLAAIGLVLGLAGCTPAVHKPATPPHTDVILNLFQWAWHSVAAECPTIGAAGFASVLVSPPEESIKGSQWWTSYQPVSYRIDSKLGSRDEFAAMVQACSAVGVTVLADAVINHMAAADRSGTGTAGSAFAEDDFPAVPYTKADFNDCRTNIASYLDRHEVQYCRLLGLQDLRTGSDAVRKLIAGYLNDLISLGVVGFRIDAAKHVPVADLAAIRALLTKPDALFVQEVIPNVGEPIQPAEYRPTGDLLDFDYARTLRADFQGGKLAELKDIASDLSADGPGADHARTFVTNHDTERNGETLAASWGAKYVQANAFMLAWPYGKPVVYSGYTFDDEDAGAPGATDTTVPDADCANTVWTCEQRNPVIAGMVRFHNAVAGTPATNWYDNGANLIGFGRGSVGFVAINNEKSPQTATFATGLAAGTYCDVTTATECASTYQADASGHVTATIPAGGVLALLGG